MASTVARIPSSARACTSEGSSSVPSARHGTAPPHECGEGIAAHEGVPAPALSSLDGLEEEPVVLPDDEKEGAHRREGVGHELAPHRDDAVVATQLAEDVPARAVRR